MPTGYPPENPFQTMTDRELQHLATGNLMDAHRVLQAGVGLVPEGTLEDDKPAGSIPLRLLCERHSEYDAEVWADCDALYKGGKALLRNPTVMQRLFPPHNAEAPQIYAERCKRAFYLNYSGTIINSLIAGLSSDPVRLAVAGVAADDGPEAAKVDQWWTDWAEEVTAPGADLEHRKSLHAFTCDAIRHASVKQGCWVLADLPRVAPTDADAVTDRATQDALKLRDPYLCLLDNEAVIDWDTDDDGTIAWAIVWGVERRRADPSRDAGSTRGLYVHTWTVWNRTGWTMYRLEVDPNKMPHPNTPVPKVDNGPHPFTGRVPLIRLKLPDGLWSMGKLESAAREHFNKRNAVAWAEFKSLFAVLYEFMGPESPAAKVPVPEAQRDPKRAVNQVRGVAHTQRRGAGDDARYIGPDVAPFKEARESCLELMREMHRLTHTLASSANTDSAALQRSGESKKDDRTDTQVVLEAFGMYGRALVASILDLVAIGRGEEEHGLDAIGFEAFDISAVADRIAEAVQLFAGVPILSATFKRVYLERLYQVALGDDADQEMLDKIHEELQSAVTQEDIELGMAPGSGLPGTPAAPEIDPNADPEADDEEADDEEQDDEDEPPARAPRTSAKPQPGRRSIVDSSKG